MRATRKPPRRIIRPGSRGGKGYYSELAEWRYGERPTPAAQPMFDTIIDTTKRTRSGEVRTMYRTLAETPEGEAVHPPPHGLPAVYAQPGQHPANVAMMHAAIADFPVPMQSMIAEAGFLMSLEAPDPMALPGTLGQTWLPPSRRPHVFVYAMPGEALDPHELITTTRHELTHAALAAFGMTACLVDHDARLAWWRFEEGTSAEGGVTQYANGVLTRTSTTGTAVTWAPGAEDTDLTGEAARWAPRSDDPKEWGMSLGAMENFCEVMAMANHAGGLDPAALDNLAVKHPKTVAAFMGVYGWMTRTSSTQSAAS